jgi:dTDP-4-dehydrorhamnose 3,5-epimerase
VSIVRTSDVVIDGPRVIEPAVYADDRGLFFESWSARRYEAMGIPGPFVQDNVSVSRARVLRGLHLQHPNGQGKLVSVLAGEAFDVAVDVRRDSPTFGRWIGVVLSAENRRQFWIPSGFAHGFVVTGEEAVFSYKATGYYDPASEQSVLWSDPDLAIAWPVAAPILSAKDAAAPRLRDVPPHRLPSA